MSATQKKLTAEAVQVMKAVDLIRLGARLQVLETEVPAISRDRLIRLYREVRGVSPPKGMLPFSADWYLTWGPNIHASLFAGIFESLRKNGGVHLERIDLLTKSYALYQEHFTEAGGEVLMDFTRAWTLLRFFDAGLLRMTPCTRCGGHFVAHSQDVVKHLVCGLCQPPSRAGATNARRKAAAKTVTLETEAVEASE
jgi:flagellar transcriptional activator FlhC